MIAWRAALAVGAGGFLGAVLRFALGVSVQRLAGASTFPLGTTAVNLLGCLAIGFLTGLLETRELLSLHGRLFLTVGVLGGFTTFSTFGYEVFALWTRGEAARAALAAALQVLGGLLLVWGGHALATGALRAG